MTAESNEFLPPCYIVLCILMISIRDIMKYRLFFWITGCASCWQNLEPHICDRKTTQHAQRGPATLLKCERIIRNGWLAGHRCTVACSFDTAGLSIACLWTRGHSVSWVISDLWGIPASSWWTWQVYHRHTPTPRCVSCHSDLSTTKKHLNHIVCLIFKNI